MWFLYGECLFSWQTISQNGQCVCRLHLVNIKCRNMLLRQKSTPKKTFEYFWNGDINVLGDRYFWMLIQNPLPFSFLQTGALLFWRVGSNVIRSKLISIDARALVVSTGNTFLVFLGKFCLLIMSITYPLFSNSFLSEWESRWLELQMHSYAWSRPENWKQFL